MQYEGDKVLLLLLLLLTTQSTHPHTRQNLKSKAPVIVWSDGEDDAQDGDASVRSGGSSSESSRNRCRACGA